QQTITSKEPRGFWQTLFEPQGAKEIFNTIMQIGGALMLLHFIGTSLYTGIQWLRGKSVDPASAADIQALRDEVKRLADAQTKKVSGGQDEAPEDGSAAETQIQSGVETQVTLAQKAAVQGQIDVEAGRLETMIADSPNGATPEMQQAATNLRDADRALDSAGPGELASVVATQAKKVDTIKASVDTIDKAVVGELGASERAALAQDAAA